MLATTPIEQDTKVSADFKRIVLEFSPGRVQELESMRQKLGMENRKDLFNYALGLLEWAIAKREEGFVIMVGNHEENRFIEISMPALDKIKPKPRLSASP
jgi:hypothetical protein